MKNEFEFKTPQQYIEALDEDRREPFIRLRNIIKENMPPGFEETISYGMIGWVVPHSIYPSGYHVDPKLPLPFLNIASQKNFIALYHNGIYADSMLLQWFISEYPKHCNYKLDMGKSCIRFKKLPFIPYELIAELVRKMTVENFIRLYKEAITKRK